MEFSNEAALEDDNYSQIDKRYKVFTDHHRQKVVSNALRFGKIQDQFHEFVLRFRLKKHFVRQQKDAAEPRQVSDKIDDQNNWPADEGSDKIGLRKARSAKISIGHALLSVNMSTSSRRGIHEVRGGQRAHHGTR